MREQTFTKQEMTENDIVLLLDTLWRRADDIPCTPKTRVAFHSVVLMTGLGGFRPEVLMSFLYNQISLWVVRDESTPTRTRIVGTPTVYQNKQRHNKIARNQSNR